jgi:hypothetical protein
MQNLFNYIELEVVPLEQRENVTKYLEENRIKLEDLLQSPLLNYVEQGKISDDYRRLTQFRIENQLKTVEDFQKFVYNSRR